MSASISITLNEGSSTRAVGTYRLDGAPDDPKVIERILRQILRDCSAQIIRLGEDTCSNPQE